MSRRSSISVMESMTCMVIKQQRGPRASLVIAWWRRQCPAGHRSDAQGDHLQVIDSPHESDALQNISGAEVGQERRLIQWQGGNCVGNGACSSRAGEACAHSQVSLMQCPRTHARGFRGQGEDTVNIKSMLKLYWLLTWLELVNIYVL